MKTALLEKVLRERFGRPVTMEADGRAARCWNPEGWKPGSVWDYDSLLYIGMQWDTQIGLRHAALRGIYGDAIGGFLTKDLLKVATISYESIYGLWTIDELQALPPVRQANAMDPDIDFFMDSANVWYYGHKAGELYVFDTATEELDSLGPIEAAINTRMDEWEAAKVDPSGGSDAQLVDSEGYGPIAVTVKRIKRPKVDLATLYPARDSGKGHRDAFEKDRKKPGK